MGRGPDGTPAAGGAPACGRFAPSPTGDLHLGSLTSALGSYLSARAAGARWLVRMEDLDRTREVVGAADRILRTLEQFGLEWDGPVVYQSRRTGLYEAALDRLRADGRVFACSCSRAQLRQLARTSDGEPVYPGTCRRGTAPGRLPPAMRFRLDDAAAVVTIEDRLQGTYVQDVGRAVGDFVVRRRDGFHAYQLAVVVDDAQQGVTEVVRGCDLLDNTPRQVLLQRALGLPRPDYAHLPVVTEPDGSKLAKRRRSVPLDPARAPALLHTALVLLRQSPPPGLRSASVATLCDWARRHWTPAPLERVSAVPLDA